MCCNLKLFYPFRIGYYLLECDLADECRAKNLFSHRIADIIKYSMSILMICLFPLLDFT